MHQISSPAPTDRFGIWLFLANMALVKILAGFKHWSQIFLGDVGWELWLQ